jgi:hypothetical protein
MTKMWPKISQLGEPSNVLTQETPTDAKHDDTMTIDGFSVQQQK